MCGRACAYRVLVARRAVAVCVAVRALTGCWSVDELWACVWSVVVHALTGCAHTPRLHGEAHIAYMHMHCAGNKRAAGHQHDRPRTARPFECNDIYIYIYIYIIQHLVVQ